MRNTGRSSDTFVRPINSLTVAILALAVLAIGTIWYLGQGGQYTPGDVRAERRLDAPLEPPAQSIGSTGWLVAPGVTLRHFESGEGPTVLVIHAPGTPFREPF